MFASGQLACTLFEEQTSCDGCKDKGVISVAKQIFPQSNELIHLPVYAQSIPNYHESMTRENNNLNIRKCHLAIHQFEETPKSP